MQAKKRYLLLISCCAFLSMGYYGYYHWKSNHEDMWYKVNLESFLEAEDILVDEDISANPRSRTKLESDASNVNNDKSDLFKNCRMENCFDFTRCDDDFKVYVYPIDDNVPPSPNYLKVLKAIQSSIYYTSDPSQACIFVLSLDTLDRDTLSKEYVRNMPHRIQRLSLWNSGQNHIVFNLFSGTWPDYEEDLGFDIGKAMLAKGSISIEKFRPNFDVSLPLFHKTHPEKGGEDGLLLSSKFPETKKYLLGFKGKRYLYGIGSEARNSLYHLHNDKDIILVTTCKHGSWREFKDERCDQDNGDYDRFDYEELLRNSSFCLVPRGRRLGSYRFLEVLHAGCVPVLVANKWVLPFAEVIDWGRAAIWSDERLLLQVPDVVRSILPSQFLAMRQQTQVLWTRYFSSVEKIILSTLEIVRERVVRARARPLSVWNSSPGALHANLGFSDHLPHFPFYYDVTGAAPGFRYTAVVFVTFGWSGLIHTSPLYKLIKNITKSKYVEKIIVVWSSSRQTAPSASRLQLGAVPVSVVPDAVSGNARYTLWSSIETDAVFSLDEDALLTTEELDFGFVVWRTFPDRIVGYPARSHYWSEAKGSWAYTSRWFNSYSLVLTGAALYHRYYQHLYVATSQSLHKKGVSVAQCDDILFNVIVANVIQRPPIKLSQRKVYKDVNPETRRPSSDLLRFRQRSACLSSLSTAFGSLPLRSASLRLDPVLYKDKVSIQRKKYRQIEKINS